jgi:uncharacterized protein (DUF433 family)
MTQSQETPAVQKTEHPYIVRMPGVCGGRPIIKGTRLSVRHVAQLYKAGDTVEEIIHTHPHLKVAAVYDAISYYLDHQQEIAQEIAANRLETLQATYNLEVDAQGFASFPGESLAR